MDVFVLKKCTTSALHLVMKHCISCLIYYVHFKESLCAGCARYDKHSWLQAFRQRGPRKTRDLQQRRRRQ